MSNLIGTKPNQVPTNGMLGTMAFVDAVDSPTFPRVEVTTDTVLDGTHSGKLIIMTSATQRNITLPLSTAVPDGWFCYLQNKSTGSGAHIITKNAGDTYAECSDGVNTWTSYNFYPEEVRMVMKDVAGFKSIVLRSFYVTIISSVSFSRPPGYRLFEGLLWSGGSSGQLSIGTAVAGGGGGGGCLPFTIPASSFAASETITIGAGGTAVTVAAVGNVGGSSSIGSLLTVGCNSTWTAGGSVLVSGSVIMQYSASYPANGFDGSLTATSSSANARTVYGGAGSSASNPGYVGSSVYGGGGGGVSYGSGLGGAAAGTSLLGGNGGAYGYYANGTAGSAPGGGGGGSSGGSQSGAGGRGECRIWGIV